MQVADHLLRMLHASWGIVNNVCINEQDFSVVMLTPNPLLLFGLLPFKCFFDQKDHAFTALVFVDDVHFLYEEQLCLTIVLFNNYYKDDVYVLSLQDTISVNVLSPLPRIFSGAGIASVLFAVCYRFYGSYSPLLVQHCLLFGKSKPQYCKPWEYLRVPKRWFRYFYLTGIVFTCCALLVELFMLSVNKTILSVLILFLVQVVRRFYECEYVSIFSNAQMSFMHFLIGVGFFVVAPISILLSQSNAAERSYLAIVLFSVHILILQYLQDLVMQQLAALRTGKNKSAGQSSEKKYYPPEGSMFHWVSCPHYILEIAIYLSFQLFLTPKWIPFSHMLLFTVCNQLCCIWMNHSWYKENFPDWASKRAMLIPYVW
ncbi:unnamed protein product [Schistosoma turkestanicum]|nr:unnamed protein product [Schistosoma turkestanicum]